MKNLVRILAFLLLLGSTIIFIIKIKVNIPISHTHLFALFIIGAISLLWANKRNFSNK